MPKEYRTIQEVSGPLMLVREVEGVKYNELGEIELANGETRRCRVLEIDGTNALVQLFENSAGINLANSKVRFSGRQMELGVSPDMLGRVFDGLGRPIDGGPEIIPEKRMDVNGLPMNPAARSYPQEFIQTGISAIDGLNTLVRGQKLPIFSASGLPHANLAAQIARQAKVLGDNEQFAVVFAAMGITFEESNYFVESFRSTGALDRTVMFSNLANDPAIERIATPRMALTAAEYFAVDKGEKVLVLLTDMTLYADALAIVSNRMDQIPSKDSMPGSLYSDLAKIYEKAVQLPNGGSITIIAVTTLSGGDITHAIPDNTGYITEGQLFLRNDSDTGKVIVDPFRSLSRLKQLVIGKKTREDHPQVMNACVRLYADAANAKTKLENGFDLSDYDERTLKFAYDYSEKLLSIDVNIGITEMLDTAWGLFAKYFSKEEVAIKEELIKKYWKEA